MCSVSAALRVASAVAASAIAASAVAASAIAASAVADSASAFTSNSEFLLQLLRAILRRFHPLGAQEELHEFLLADLAGRACDLDQFLDEAGELLARYIVVGPAEVAVAMENLGDRLFERFALVRDPFLVLSQLRVLRLPASNAATMRSGGSEVSAIGPPLQPAHQADFSCLPSAATTGSCAIC